jgi:hypothetical protein
MRAVAVSLFQAEEDKDSAVARGASSHEEVGA